MIPSHLPIYDRPSALKITGNNSDLADDLLTMLLNRLRQDIDEINETSHFNDPKRLYTCTHKLLGAVRYCGLPRLEFILTFIESHLKKEETKHLSFFLQNLNLEASKILASFPTKIAC